MKPFNLEACMKGERVTTRDGRTYHFGGFNSSASKECQLVGWVGAAPTTISHTKEGHFMYSLLDSDSDLFMYEEPKVKKEGWINIYKSTLNTLYTYCEEIYASESAAEVAVNKPHYLFTVKVEWEE